MEDVAGLHRSERNEEDRGSHERDARGSPPADDDRQHEHHVAICITWMSEMPSCPDAPAMAGRNAAAGEAQKMTVSSEGAKRRSVATQAAATTAVTMRVRACVRAVSHAAAPTAKSGTR